MSIADAKLIVCGDSSYQKTLMLHRQKVDFLVLIFPERGVILMAWSTYPGNYGTLYPDKCDSTGSLARGDFIRYVVDQPAIRLLVASLDRYSKGGSDCSIA